MPLGLQMTIIFTIDSLTIKLLIEIANGPAANPGTSECLIFWLEKGFNYV